MNSHIYRIAILVYIVVISFMAACSSQERSPYRSPIPVKRYADDKISKGYSPNKRRETPYRTVLGKNGKTSIRRMKVDRKDVLNYPFTPTDLKAGNYKTVYKNGKTYRERIRVEKDVSNYPYSPTDLKAGNYKTVYKNGKTYRERIRVEKDVSNYPYSPTDLKAGHYRTVYKNGKLKREKIKGENDTRETHYNPAKVGSKPYSTKIIDGKIHTEKVEKEKRTDLYPYIPNKARGQRSHKYVYVTEMHNGKAVQRKVNPMKVKPPKEYTYLPTGVGKRSNGKYTYITVIEDGKVKQKKVPKGYSMPQYSFPLDSAEWGDFRPGDMNDSSLLAKDAVVLGKIGTRFENKDSLDIQKWTKDSLGNYVMVDSLMGDSLVNDSIPNPYEDLEKALEIKITDEDDIEFYKVASQWLGVKYRKGKCKKKAVDAVGLVCMLYKERYGINIEHYIGSSNTIKGSKVTGGESLTLRINPEEELKEECRELARHNLQPGDLIFFKMGKSSKVNHVAIYLKDNVFIHSYPGGRVRVDKLEGSYANGWDSGGMLGR